jgi:hypothetical protein
MIREYILFEEILAEVRVRDLHREMKSRAWAREWYALVAHDAVVVARAVAARAGGSRSIPQPRRLAAGSED